MPRTTKQATRTKLRNAVVAEAVEQGIGAVSVGGVVKRAAISAGTVYVHFSTKDDMLRDIYMEIKTEFHDLLMKAADQQKPAQAIRCMWFAMFDFVATNPKELLFLEYGNAAKILTVEQQAITDGYAEEISDILKRGVADGTLAPLDTSILTLLLIAPAMQLARGAAISNTPLSQETLNQTFDRVWLSIAASPL